MKNYSNLQPLQLYVRKTYTVCINILLDLWLGLSIESLGTSMHPRPRLHIYVHFAGQIDKRLQNIILLDALFLYVGQPIKTREESNIPYLSVFPICSVLPLKGRPNIKLIDTCGSRFMVSRQLLSIHSLNLQLIRTFFIIKIWFLLVLVVMCSHSHQASDGYGGPFWSK